MKMLRQAGPPALAALAALCLAAPARGQSPTIAITHVTVIDVERGSRLADRTVVVRDGRIAGVGRSIAAPAGSRVLDGRGRFLIPGLWDMHAHLDIRGIGTNVFMPLEIANGITGIREMASDCVDRRACAQAMTIDTVRAWQREIAAGDRVGPRIVASSQMLDGAHSTWSFSYAVPDAAAARDAVARFAARKVDFLKVYSLLPRDAFIALAAEARRRGLPFAGHVPIGVPTLEAARAGMASMEHGYGLQEGCSSNEPALRARQVRIIDSTVAARESDLWVEPIYVEQAAEAFASYDA